MFQEMLELKCLLKNSDQQSNWQWQQLKLKNRNGKDYQLLKKSEQLSFILYNKYLNIHYLHLKKKHSIRIKPLVRNLYNQSFPNSRFSIFCFSCVQFPCLVGLFFSTAIWIWNVHIFKYYYSFLKDSSKILFLFAIILHCWLLSVDFFPFRIIDRFPAILGYHNGAK